MAYQLEEILHLPPETIARAGEGDEAAICPKYDCRLNLEIAPGKKEKWLRASNERLRAFAGDRRRRMKHYNWHATIRATTQACEIVGDCSAYLPSRTIALALRLMFLRIRLRPGTST